jgi:hypothetical protein
MPKIGDNFDKKYCEMPEKLGNDTHDRYARFLHNEDYPVIFNEFTCCNTECNEEIERSKGNTNTEQIKTKTKIADTTKTKYNPKQSAKNPVETAGSKLKNVKVYLNNINKTKLNSLNGINAASTTNKLGKLTFNSMNFDKGKFLKMSTNTNNRAYIQPLSLNLNTTNIKVNNKSKSNSITNTNSNSNSNYHSLEITKIPLIQNSAKIDSSSHTSTKYSANTLLRNRTNSLLNNKQVNPLMGSYNTNTNNSSNSNTSNMPTNYIILPREKRTNSLIGISSPVAAMSLLPKQKEVLPRSSSNFNTMNVVGNSFNRKKNSCDIETKEYERYKISKVFSKNSQSLSGPVSIQLGSHLKNNSIPGGVGKLK